MARKTVSVRPPSDSATESTTFDWRNRIVHYGVKRASEFCANPHNWRKHPEEQRQALASALGEVGWVAPVIENVRTGYLVDGHERVWQALQNGDAEVPFVQVDLAPEEEALVLATFDPIGAMAQADGLKLAALLEEIRNTNDQEGRETGLEPLLLQLTKSAEALVDQMTNDTGGLADVPEELDGVFMLKPDIVFESSEPFGIPPLREDRLLDVDTLQLWPGDDLRHLVGDDGPVLLNYATSCRTLDLRRVILAFYTDDYRFEHLWFRPEAFTTKLLNAKVQGVIAPNYSLWMRSAEAVRIWNVYRSRWLARYFQEAGIPIIPDVNWSGRSDYHFCFAGIPTGAPAVSVQLQTFNPRNSDEVDAVTHGLLTAIQRLSPQKLIAYASKAGRQLLENLKIPIPVIVLPTLMDHRREKLSKTFK